MRKALKVALIIVSVIAFITLAGALLYWLFRGKRMRGGCVFQPGSLAAYMGTVV